MPTIAPAPVGVLPDRRPGLSDRPEISRCAPARSQSVTAKREIALNALHKDPGHAWTLDELASTAGTSRSVLAERFLKLVGSPPMQYLTQWRMLLAANLLRSSNSSLIRIAEEVGYQTDTAFSRAFRREFGAPPATWRRGQEKRTMAHGPVSH